ncbi:MAG: hypothetical protein ABH848_03955 [Candidatus Omnitrophota bacterium]
MLKPHAAIRPPTLKLRRAGITQYLPAARHGAIRIIIASIFLFNNIAYGIDLSKDSHLRVPLSRDNYQRITHTIETFQDNQTLIDPNIKKSHLDKRAELFHESEDKEVIDIIHNALKNNSLGDTIDIFKALQGQKVFTTGLEGNWREGGLWLVDPKEDEPLPDEHASDFGGIHIVKYPDVDLRKAYAHAMAAYVGFTHKEADKFAKGIIAWIDKGTPLSQDLIELFRKASINRRNDSFLLTKLSRQEDPEKKETLKRDYTMPGKDDNIIPLEKIESLVNTPFYSAILDVVERIKKGDESAEGLLNMVLYDLERINRKIEVKNIMDKWKKRYPSEDKEEVDLLEIDLDTTIGFLNDFSRNIDKIRILMVFNNMIKEIISFLREEKKDILQLTMGELLQNSGISERYRATIELDNMVQNKIGIRFMHETETETGYKFTKDLLLKDPAVKKIIEYAEKTLQLDVEDLKEKIEDIFAKVAEEAAKEETEKREKIQPILKNIIKDFVLYVLNKDTEVFFGNNIFLGEYLKDAGLYEYSKDDRLAIKSALREFLGEELREFGGVTEGYNFDSHKVTLGYPDKFIQVVVRLLKAAPEYCPELMNEEINNIPIETFRKFILAPEERKKEILSDCEDIFTNSKDRAKLDSARNVIEEIETIQDTMRYGSIFISEEFRDKLRSIKLLTGGSPVVQKPKEKTISKRKLKRAKKIAKRKKEGLKTKKEPEVKLDAMSLKEEILGLIKNIDLYTTMAKGGRISKFEEFFGENIIPLTLSNKNKLLDYLIESVIIENEYELIEAIGFFFSDEYSEREKFAITKEQYNKLSDVLLVAEQYREKYEYEIKIIKNISFNPEKDISLHGIDDVPYHTGAGASFFYKYYNPAKELLEQGKKEEAKDRLLRFLQALKSYENKEIDIDGLRSVFEEDPGPQWDYIRDEHIDSAIRQIERLLEKVNEDSESKELDRNETAVNSLWAALIENDGERFKTILQSLIKDYDVKKVFIKGSGADKAWQIETEEFGIFKDYDVYSVVKKLFSDSGEQSSGERVNKAIFCMLENIHDHVKGYGVILVREIFDKDKGKGVEVVSLDNGQGIDNIDEARGTGFSILGEGRGFGTSIIIKAMDELVITSNGKEWVKGEEGIKEVDWKKGTKILARKWLQRLSKPDSEEQNERTILNSNGKTFEDIWNTFKNKGLLEGVSDPMEWPIEPDEKEFAASYEKMSIEELREVFKELISGDKPIIESSEWMLKKEDPLLTFIDTLSIPDIESALGKPYIEIKHHFRLAEERCNTIKFNKKEGIVSDEKEKKYAKLLIDAYRYKAFMREIIKRWDKPEDSESEEPLTSAQKILKGYEKDIDDLYRINKYGLEALSPEAREVLFNPEKAEWGVNFTPKVWYEVYNFLIYSPDGFASSFVDENIDLFKLGRKNKYYDSQVVVWHEARIIQRAALKELEKRGLSKEELESIKKAIPDPDKYIEAQKNGGIDSIITYMMSSSDYYETEEFQSIKELVYKYCDIVHDMYLKTKEWAWERVSSGLGIQFSGRGDENSFILAGSYNMKKSLVKDLHNHSKFFGDIILAKSYILEGSMQNAIREFKSALSISDDEWKPKVISRIRDELIWLQENNIDGVEEIAKALGMDEKSLLFPVNLEDLQDTSIYFLASQIASGAEAVKDFKDALDKLSNNDKIVVLVDSGKEKDFENFCIDNKIDVRFDIMSFEDANIQKDKIDSYRTPILNINNLRCIPLTEDMLSANPELQKAV